ncbi:hypothetical protein BDW22DRAFT_1349674 [Trametopsis cervina]|nr:hypothetical protein BDW22DRAFT_1349674 [Trametopsis cervina]
MASHHNEPWYLTVVRTQGMQFVRPEKSWRPIVSVTVVEHERTHETVLGSDGRNPNLKAPIELREVHHASRIDVKVWHQSHTKKTRRKRYLIGSAYVTLGEIVKRQDRPGSDTSLNLSCPPPQKRAATLVGNRKLNSAMLTIRLTPPSPSATDSIPDRYSQESTLVSSPYTSDHVFSDDDIHSGTAHHGSPPESPTLSDTEGTSLLSLRPENGENVLRRRRKARKSQKLKAYYITASDEEANNEISDSESSSEPEAMPELPPSAPLPPSLKQDEESTVSFDDVASISFPASEYSHNWSVDVYASDAVYAHTVPQISMPMTRAEHIVDTFSPYAEMCHPQCDFGKVLARLVTEWYAVGGCLLATATLNAAVFGYSSGTLFNMDSLALRAVTIGSTASALGLVIDAWFLLLYTSSVPRFQRLAADITSSASGGVTYFYFCLICRLPTFCLFVATCALMVFLLVVAWGAWPGAVLVMCFGAGIVLTIQYLVYGVRMLGEGIVRAARIVRRGIRAVLGWTRREKGARERLSVPPMDLHSQGCVTSPPPPPYSSPQVPLREIGNADASASGSTGDAYGENANVATNAQAELGPSISRRTTV